MPSPVSSREPIGSEPDPLPGGFDAPLAVRALEAAGTGVCIADARRPMLPMVWANEAFSERTGLPREEIAAGSCRMLQWTDIDPARLGELLASLRDGESPVVELKHRRRREGGSSHISFSPVFDCDGVLTHLIGVHEGAGTEDDPLTAAAMNHDALTGLPNRVVLEDRLGQALGRLRRRCGSVGVLFVDVDGFKQVNDRYGHQAGDDFLRELPTRLNSALRADDTIARLGGDEFVIMLEDCGGETGAVQVAERVLQAFEAPFTLGDETLALRVSVGIAVADSSDETAEEVLTNADVAMYRAKNAGGDGHAVFDSTLRARANERVGLARDLRAAIGTDQLSLHYQPIVDLGSQRVTSVEALLRWEHPVRGQIPPDEFVRLAEQTGIIVELGRWVLDRACTEFAAALNQAGDKQIELAVNLSPRQLADLGLPELLRDIMARTGLGRGRVALEITETALTHESDSPAERLWALKQEGCASCSTTSAPATRRWATCAAFRSTRSRSTAPSWTAWAPSPVTPPSWAPSSRWRARWTLRSSPRAWRPRARWRTCTHWAAATPRATCSPAPPPWPRSRRSSVAPAAPLPIAPPTPSSAGTNRTSRPRWPQATRRTPPRSSALR